MPSGAEAFARKAEQKQQRAGGGVAAAGDLNRLKVKKFALAGNTYGVVRFLEQGSDLTFIDRHEIPAGGRYPGHFACLDPLGDGTPCPACESSDPAISKKAPRGLVTLIWREGPIWKLTEAGWPAKDPTTKQNIVLGREDAVFLWNCSWDVFADLMAKDIKHKGLMLRDYEVKRTGFEMNDTKYHIEPADIDGGPQPMTIADNLIAASKPDLAAISTPLDYASLHQVVHGGANPSGGPQPTFDQSQRVAPTAGNVFQGDQPVRSSAFARG